jgi:hypothetical protein
LDYDEPVDYDVAEHYDAGAELMHQVISYAPSYRDIRNLATYQIARRAQQTLQKVWEYGGPLVLGPGESRLITATLSDPCDTATAPVAATDYTVSAGALASVPTLEHVYAQNVGIRFIAGAGGATVLGVTSNGPQLRARPYPQLSAEVVQNAVDASASILRTKGPSAIGISGRREINRSFAIAVCDAAVQYSMVNRPVVEMPVTNIDGNHLREQLLIDVSDRVSIVSEQLGMSSGGDFWVEQIRHQRQPGMLVTTFTCERVESVSGGGRWDEGLWDVMRFGT